MTPSRTSVTVFAFRFLLCLFPGIFLVLLLIPSFVWSYDYTYRSRVRVSNAVAGSQSLSGHLVTQKYPWVGSVSYASSVCADMGRTVERNGKTYPVYDIVSTGGTYTSLGYGLESRCVLVSSSLDGSICNESVRSCCTDRDDNGNCVYQSDKLYNSGCCKGQYCNMDVNIVVGCWASDSGYCVGTGKQWIDGNCIDHCEEAINYCNTNGGTPHFNYSTSGETCFGYCDYCSSSWFKEREKQAQEECCSHGLGFAVGNCTYEAMVPTPENGYGQSFLKGEFCYVYDGILTPPGCSVDLDASSSSVAESSSSSGGDVSSSSSESGSGEGSSGSGEGGEGSSGSGEGGGEGSSGSGGGEGEGDWEYDYRDSLHKIITRLDDVNVKIDEVADSIGKMDSVLIALGKMTKEELKKLQNDLNFWGRMVSQYQSKGIMILDSIAKYDSLANIMGLRGVELDSMNNEILKEMLDIMSQPGGDLEGVEGSLDSILDLLGRGGDGVDTSGTGATADGWEDGERDFEGEVAGVLDSVYRAGMGDSGFLSGNSCEGEECCYGDTCIGWHRFGDSLQASIKSDWDSMPGLLQESYDTARKITPISYFDSTLLAGLGATIPNTNTCPEKCVSWKDANLGDFGKSIGFTGGVDFGICDTGGWFPGSMNVLQFIRLIARLITAVTCIAIAGWEIATTRGRIGF